MPIEKIANPRLEEVCIHPDHVPPQYITIDPGVYRHTCPACGKQTIFTVPGRVC